MIGTVLYMDASFGAPSFGCLIAITSAKHPTVRTVSSTLSPLETDESVAEENPITFPPISSIADSKLSLVLVEIKYLSNLFYRQIHGIY